MFRRGIQNLNLVEEHSVQKLKRDPVSAECSCSEERVKGMRQDKRICGGSECCEKSAVLARNLVPWEVSVANLIKREPDLLISRWIQGPPICEAFHQVRIADEGPAKGNQVRMVVADRSFRRFLGVTAVADERAFEHIPEFCQGHFRSKSMEAEGEAIHDVEIRDLISVELFCDIEKSLTEIR